MLTFIPDKDTSRKIITVSDKSQDSLTDSSGKQYKIHSAVKAYYNGEEKTFGDVQPNIRVGASVTLFFDAAGDLDYLLSAELWQMRLSLWVHREARQGLNG